MYTKFNAEQDAWLKEYCHLYAYKELTDMYNKKFGTYYTWSREKPGPVERRCRKIGLSRTETSYGYTKEEDEWLKEFAPKYSSNWLSKNIESVSGRKHSSGSIKHHVREELNVSKGNGGRRIDTVHPNDRAVGEITTWGDKKYIKINDTGDDKVDFKPYGRYLYEQHYRTELPSNYQVIHLDGDNNNFDIDNLCAISHRENGIIAANGWHGKGEITKTAVQYARLRVALADNGYKFKRGE